MPNASVRPSARVLPEATNRRAVLGATLAAGATGALPPRHALSSHPDAELLALGPEMRPPIAKMSCASRRQAPPRKFFSRSDRRGQIRQSPHAMEGTDSAEAMG